VEDYGSDDPIYANTAHKVAKAVADGKHERGILFCGTGLGMSIAANKVPGAYAIVGSDPYSVERSIKSNNANILTLGSLVAGEELSKSVIDLWLKFTYEPGGRSEPKIQGIYEVEKKYFRK